MSDKGDHAVEPDTRSRDRSPGDNKRQASGRSRSRSRSPAPRRDTRHRSRSRSPVRRRSRSPVRRRSRSRSRSRSPARRRSRSRSRSPPRRSGSYRRSRSPRASRESPPENRQIGVFGMNTRTTEEDLRSIFKKYGPIESVIIVRDRMQENRSRGFGFVTFEDIADAREAREMSGKQIDNATVRVDFSATRGPHKPTPGRYMGVATRRHGSRSPSPRRDRRSRSRSRSRSPRRR